MSILDSLKCRTHEFYYNNCIIALKLINISMSYPSLYPPKLPFRIKDLKADLKLNFKNKGSPPTVKIDYHGN